MTKRWNTARIAIWGAVLGPIYLLIQASIDRHMPETWSLDSIIYLISFLGGGALGGAALFALVSGVRNLILRAK